jgi:membrane protease YdiL (CAAX protease family)
VNDSSIPADNSPPVIGTPAGGATPVKRWRWWAHLLLVTSYPLFLGIVGKFSAEDRGPALTGTARGLLVASGLALLSFAIVFGVAWLASQASRDDLLLRWRNGFWNVPLGIGYSIALRLALGIVVAVIVTVLVLTHVMTPDSLKNFAGENRPNVEAVVDVSALRQNPLYYWLVLTVVSFVVAGLREELWRSGFLAGMRALWPNRFSSRGGQLAAAAVAAVVFGIGHWPQGVIAAVMAGVLGFGLGVIMVLHRSIWPAVIAHGMFDATTLAVLPWALEQMKQLQQSIGH